MTAETPRWRVNLLLAAVITALSAVHFAETLIWAGPIHALGMIPILRDSYCYVLESYTTLGEGNVSPPDHWRLDRSRAPRVERSRTDRGG